MFFTTKRPRTTLGTGLARTNTGTPKRIQISRHSRLWLGLALHKARQKEKERKARFRKILPFSPKAKSTRMSSPRRSSLAEPEAVSGRAETTPEKETRDPPVSSPPRPPAPSPNLCATAAFHRFPTRLCMFSKRTWKGRTPRTTVARGAAPGGRQVRGGFPCACGNLFLPCRPLSSRQP